VALRAIISLLNIGSAYFDSFTGSTEMIRVESLITNSGLKDTHLFIGKNSEVVRDPITVVIGTMREQRWISRIRFFIRLAFVRRSILRMSTIPGFVSPATGRRIAVNVTTVPVA
jgi:hypothetical protein